MVSVCRLSGACLHFGSRADFATTKIRTPTTHIEFSTKGTSPPGEVVLANWAASPSAAETNNVAHCLLKEQSTVFLRAAVLATPHHPVYASPGTGLTKLKLPHDKKPALWLREVPARQWPPRARTTAIVEDRTLEPIRSHWFALFLVTLLFVNVCRTT